MKILVTNDDGYQSSGLQMLCSQLSLRGHDVYVIAPDGQRSGFSHAIDFHKNLTFRRLASYCGAKEAYICSGTPADCARIGYLHLGIKFDLLIAGPNNGANSGRSIIYSGTVGAAEEGTMCGITSIALSRLGHGGPYFSTVEYLVDNLEKLASIKLPNAFLNINVPDLPTSEIKGVKVCSQSLQLPLFDDYYEEVEDGVVQILGKRMECPADDSDVSWCDNGYITITPLSISRTDYDSLTVLKSLEK